MTSLLPRLFQTASSLLLSSLILTSTSQAEIPKTEDFPEYTPDIAERDGDPTHRHQIVNAMDFGAVADGQSHPLKEILPTQEEIDKKYGSGRYTPDDERDFVAIMEAIRAAKRSGQYGPDIKAVRYASTVRIPAGVYIINRTIPLTDTYGGSIEGDGRLQTILRFNKEAPLFFITRCSFLTFEKFAIESNISSKSIGFLINEANTEADPKYLGKVTFNMTFDSMMMNRFYKAIQITGNVMTDSMAFNKVRFLQCLTAFHLQNPQGLNYQFISCNFEVHGDESTFAPYKESDVVCFHIQAGGDITVIGGNIIHAGITLLLEPDAAFAPSGKGPSISWGSGIYNFYGVRWEQMGGTQPALFESRGKEAFTARINFDSCMVYQRVAALGKPVGFLRPGMNVTFRNSVFNNGVIEEVIGGRTGKRPPALILDNTSGVTFQRVPGEVPEKLRAYFEKRGPQE